MLSGCIRPRASDSTVLHLTVLGGTTRRNGQTWLYFGQNGPDYMWWHLTQREEPPTQSKGPDITARRGSEVFELEAKCVSAYSGVPVHPADQDQLWDRVRRGFTAWADERTVPMVNVSVKEFDDLAMFGGTKSYFNRVKDAVFSSPNKVHVCQIVFSAGFHLSPGQLADDP